MESVLNSHINSLEEYNNDDFKKLNEIFEKNK